MCLAGKRAFLFPSSKPDPNKMSDKHSVSEQNQLGKYFDYYFAFHFNYCVGTTPQKLTETQQLQVILVKICV